MKKGKSKSSFLQSIIKKKNSLILGVLFLLHIFFRFYLLEQQLHFNWDQVDNAWGAVRIGILHEYPLLGMVAKLNSGFHIGPLYYYFVFLFYWLFNYNPIASGVIAGVTSIITFFALFYVAKKLFSTEIALIAVALHTFSFFIISSDRSQWPVNFIVPISLVIFYALYNILVGRVKYIILLAITLGLSFHIHFTSVFYPIIILLSLPFFPWKKESLKYIGIGSVIFLLFLSPIIVAELLQNDKGSSSLMNYVQTYYHGLHLVRVLQITHDAFIEFELSLRVTSLLLGPTLLSLFSIVYFLQKPSRERTVLVYLVGLWFVVPWIVFAVYSGEISNYYFFMTRPMVIIICAYFSYTLFSKRILFLRALVFSLWMYFIYSNTTAFFREGNSDYAKNQKNTLETIQKGEKVLPYQNIPESYLYWYFTQKNK